MKQFILAIFASLALSIQAQVLQPFSQQLQKGTVLDTARFLVTYNLKYKNHPADKNYLTDIRNVLIGKHWVKDFSDIIFHYDSLSTAEYKRGSSVLSNPKGSPWPIELSIHEREKKAEIKYRMPLETGVLHYKESIPTFDWAFTEETDTILGYACSKATTSFAGRVYTAWFTMEIPLPFGPYKFGGLPGLILKIQDNEAQYIWEAKGFEKSKSQIMAYSYKREKTCTTEEARKTITRIFNSPLSFIAASMGGAKIVMLDKEGRPKKSSETDSSSIPYKALEIEVK